MNDILILNKVENIVAKGEIANHEHLLLVTQCFQKSSAVEASESICMRKKTNKKCLHLHVCTDICSVCLFIMLSPTDLLA